MAEEEINYMAEDETFSNVVSCRGYHFDYGTYLYISIFSCWLAFLGYSQSLLDMNVSSSIDLEARDEGKSAGIFSLRFLRCYYNG